MVHFIIAVTAEIVPVVPGHQRLPIELVSSDEVPVGAMGIMSSSVSSGAITSSSFMPTTSMGASATLPRNLENGFAGLKSYNVVYRLDIQ